MPCYSNLQLEWVPVRKVLRSLDLSGEVHAEQEIHLALTMLPILDEASLRALVREVLKERGWKQADDGSLSKKIGTAIATLSPDGAEVSLKQTADTIVVVPEKVRVSRNASAKEIEAAARK